MLEDVSITIVIIIATVLVSLLAFNNRTLQYRLIFSPYRVKHKGEWYRVITHAFIHKDFMHLLVNMFVLNGFGEVVEAHFGKDLPIMGRYYFILLYVGGFFFATLPAMRKHGENPAYMSLGASGAVSAVVFSFMIIAPTEPLTLVFLPFFNLPAFIFGILYVGFEIYMDRRGGSGIAHDAHLWGALYGTIFTIGIHFQYLRDFIDSIKGMIT